MKEKRQISLASGVAIAISMVIGSGLFGLPGLAIQAAGPLNSLIGWAVVVAIMPAMIHIFSYLGRKYPESEGVALYASMGFGTWSKNGILMLTAGTLLIGMPAFFLVGGSYAASLLGLDTSTWSIPLAIAIAILTTLANIFGLKQLGWFNTVAILLIVSVILFVCARSLPYIPQLLEVERWRQPEVGNISSIWLAAGIVFWAFQGWENLTFGFGEIKDPDKNIPKIFWISFLVVSVCYLGFAAAIAASAMEGYSVEGLNGLASIVPNGVVGKIMLGLMVIILLANANSWVFGSSRAFYSAAKAGTLPSFLSTTSKDGTPTACLVTALLAYSLIIWAIGHFALSPEIAFLATTQGFIILYGGAILAYTRKTTGLANRLISIIAALGWIFLAQGFGSLMLYSIFWFLAGVGLSLKKKEKPAFEASH
ncbi:APC family permease [uncultured Pseudomonas sp.]|uniref:APC family permease n=1 Tax=uncultured Pseudomonas sp. TaxID=114707 RepID=UPI0025E52BA5|nr:APC family permease [uncultured Pseudomonas sp.]